MASIGKDRSKVKKDEKREEEAMSRRPNPVQVGRFS
jgi:hypothetical protein